MDERNDLIKELFELHKLLADKGEIVIGYGFSKNYNRLKKQVKKLTLTDVVKTLPNKEKLNFEDWLEFKKIDKLSDGAYRREGSLYTEYYVKSSYETYLK